MKTNPLIRAAIRGLPMLPTFGGGPAWMRRDDLPCITADNPDLWFAHDQSDIDQAAARCEFLCPVRALCEQAAVDRNEKNGVWGGVNMSWSANQELRYQQRADVDRYRDEVVWLASRGRAPQQIAKAIRITETRVRAITRYLADERLTRKQAAA